LKNPAVTYSSGLSAIHAALTFLNPPRVAIGDGYHGSHGVIAIHERLTGMKKLPLDCAASSLDAGDLIMLETPVNPSGKAFNIEHYAQKAHSRGAYLMVDSTFAPPPLQDPFLYGADIVMHSGTKYLGGHSDMLCGVLAVKQKEWVGKLKEERTYLGNVMGGLEGWLGVRSIRTLEVRVQRQSFSADKIVSWLDEALKSETLNDDSKAVKAVVQKVEHASLQKSDFSWLKKQMPNGFGPVFSILMKNDEVARKLPSKLDLFHHATSLGGVESLIEWRTMTDATVDRRLLRVSIGLEGWEDLRGDLAEAFRQLAKEIS
jgi:cystathionine beta-lyase/cystathionine gamma-synthase